MEIRLKQFKDALDGFKELVNVDLEELNKKVDSVVVDGIKNGQAQKFEYCTELCWKVIKLFLFQYDGLDEKSPKQAIKAFYLAGHCDENVYKKLLDIINDRNKLSHIYNENEFNIILSSFNDNIIVFEKIYDVITSKII